jgi:hypothetical protein
VRDSQRRALSAADARGQVRRLWPQGLHCG